MMGLSDSERILMMRSAVLTQSTRVTVRRTDGIGVAYTRYSIYAVVRNKNEDTMSNVYISAQCECNLMPLTLPAANAQHP